MKKYIYLVLIGILYSSCAHRQFTGLTYTQQLQNSNTRVSTHRLDTRSVVQEKRYSETEVRQIPQQDRSTRTRQFGAYSYTEADINRRMSNVRYSSNLNVVGNNFRTVSPNKVAVYALSELSRIILVNLFFDRNYSYGNRIWSGRDLYNYHRGYYNLPPRRQNPHNYIYRTHGEKIRKIMNPHNHRTQPYKVCLLN